MKEGLGNTRQREGLFFLFPPTTKRQQGQKDKWRESGFLLPAFLGWRRKASEQGKQSLQQKTASALFSPASATQSSSAGAAPSLHHLLSSDALEKLHLQFQIIQIQENMNEEKMQDPPPNGSASGQEKNTDYTDPRLPNIDEKKMQGSSSNGPASGRKKNADPAKTIKQKLASNKKAIIGIVISHLIFGIFLFSLGTLVPLNHQKNAIKCPSVTCPFDWIGHKGRCYNLSVEEKNWKESQNFCMSHNASLAKITKEEMDFVTNLTRNHVFWIGLKREPDQPWKWLDGENSTLEVKGNGEDCAYLADDATANSGTCSIEHRYICKKNDFMIS